MDALQSSYSENPQSQSTASFSEIMEEIKEYYIKNDIVPKIPENWNPNIMGNDSEIRN